jgi:hypothetical protein
VIVAVIFAALALLPAPAEDLSVLDGQGVRVVYTNEGLARAAAQVAEAVPRFVGEQAVALGITAPERVTVSLASSSPRDAGRARALGLDGMPVWAAGIARGGTAFIGVRLDRLGRYPDRTLNSVLAHEVAHLMLDRARGAGGLRPGLLLSLLRPRQGGQRRGPRRGPEDARR